MDPWKVVSIIGAILVAVGSWVMGVRFDFMNENRDIILENQRRIDVLEAQHGAPLPAHRGADE